MVRKSASAVPKSARPAAFDGAGRKGRKNAQIVEVFVIIVYPAEANSARWATASAGAQIHPRQPAVCAPSPFDLSAKSAAPRVTARRILSSKFSALLKARDENSRRRRADCSDLP